MAMASIKVENGLFVKGKRGITVIDETHAEGNGWVCERMGNKILCRTSKECSDGVHIVKLKIDIVKGTIRLIRKTPNQPKEIFQNIFKNRNLYDGEIVLSKEDVAIDMRYAFYRETTFTDFLERYHIDKCIYLSEEELNLLELPIGGFSVWRGVEEKHYATTISHVTPIKDKIYKGIHYKNGDNGVTVDRGFASWVIYDDIEKYPKKTRTRILYTSIKDLKTLEEQIKEAELHNV